MTRDEAVEVLIDGKSVRQNYWDVDDFIKVEDGKLYKYNNGSRHLCDFSKDWWPDGWELQTKEIDKYEAIRILFAGGYIKYAGKVVKLADVKSWAKFTEWEETGYYEQV